MKRIFVLSILCALIFSLNAQINPTPAKNSDGVKSVTAAKADMPAKCGTKDCQTMIKLKREYFEENFKLEEKQKAAFWAAYDARTEAEFEAFNASRDAMKAAGITKHIRPDSIQFLSDKQILALYNNRLSTKQKLAQAEYDFFVAISKCLTAKQVDEYFQLDQKFKRSAAKHKGEPDCKHGNPEHPHNGDCKHSGADCKHSAGECPHGADGKHPAPAPHPTH